MEKVETDTRRLVYFSFIRGNVLRGDGQHSAWGPRGKAAPAALTP